MRYLQTGSNFGAVATRRTRLGDPLLQVLSTYQSSGLLHMLDVDTLANQYAPFREVLTASDSGTIEQLAGTTQHVPVLQPGGPAVFPNSSNRAALLYTMTSKICDFGFVRSTVTDSFTLIAVVRPGNNLDGSRRSDIIAAMRPNAGGALTQSWYFGVEQSATPSLVLVEPTSNGVSWNYGGNFQTGQKYIVAATVDQASHVLRIFVNDPVTPKAMLNAPNPVPHVDGGLWTIGGSRISPTAWEGLIACPLIFERDVTLLPGGSALPALFRLLNQQYGLGIAGLS